MIYVAGPNSGRTESAYVMEKKKHVILEKKKLRENKKKNVENRRNIKEKQWNCLAENCGKNRSENVHNLLQSIRNQ